ncbi:MAG: DEAD/DEAH box helicase [Phascolarctobacterium sp.]|nr:DEAD/DEAH box helicase [Phascolarctobacterium sp.]
MSNIELMMPLKATPYEHQKNAFAFACEKFGVFDGRIKSRGVALLMEMGTGKTVVSIAVAGCLYQNGKINRVLVVALLSIVGVWKEEFEKFADFPYSLTVLKGTAAKKKEQLTKLPEEGLQVVVVNYESAWRLEKELLAYDAELVIADEAHKLKENRTNQSKGMHHLGDRAKYKLLLTGTVITNHEMDVFSQYRFLNPQIFGMSFYSFRSRYFDMAGYRNHIPVFRRWMMDDFLQKMHSVAFRVTKSECLDLPEIVEEIRTVDLEPKALKLYDGIEDESYAEMEKSEVTTVNIFTRLLRLSQITGGHLTDDDGIVNSVSTAKLDALSDIIDTCMAEDKKLVIMARFVPELDDIEELLEKKKIHYAVVRGGVKNRNGEIRSFQYDEKCKVFVGQIAAAGLGITLTAASTMVFYSLDYSMSNFEQAKARIHRAGQRENCHYIYLICRGTIDHKVLSALRKKQNLAKLLVDDYRKGKNPFKS